MARRKKEPVSNHRKNISMAANELFIKNGVERTTVDSIAKLAGYSKASLYVYFENKEEIFFYLVYQHTKEFYKTIKKITEHHTVSQESLENDYLNLCFTLQKFCEEYPIYFDGMIGHINVDLESKSTPQVYKDIYQLGLDINQSIAIFIEHATRLDYLVPNLDADWVTLFFWGSLSGIIRMARNKKEYYDLLGLDKEEFLKDQFLRLLTCYKKG